VPCSERWRIRRHAIGQAESDEEDILYGHVGRLAFGSAFASPWISSAQ
jgi:hypothetical protein|tara:strand:- start:81 stop:224 length:144 start_codon:yes stop_codon:yes gene_type:complete